jgi:RND family efflux transporter MFP subunit
LNLLPAERHVLEANLALNQAQLEEARLDLDRTVIRLPFDARIAEVLAETAQFVSAGQKLAVADSIDVAEVSAQIALNQIRPLIQQGADLTSLSAEQLSQLPGEMGFTAEVRLVAGDFTATWEARFDRISDTVDPQTRTLGLVVAVDEPYRKTIPGRRPPLTKNMYVEVEVRGARQANRIAVPRVAVHRGVEGGHVVYLAGSDGRLAFRPVTLGSAQSDFVIVEQGLEGGERVVASDLIPAIEGMLLAPRMDEALAGRLAAQAGGAGELR